MFCKSQVKQTCKPKHPPSPIAPGVWVAPPHAELCGFSSNTSSHALSCCPTVTAGKRSILCFSTFLFLWILWSGAFFSLICWFQKNFLSFFTSAVSVLGIIYNLKALTRGWFKKIPINVDFEWQNWVRVCNRSNSYVSFIVLDSLERFKSLILQPKGGKYVISQNIFAVAVSREYTAQSVRRHLLSMFKLGLLSELFLLFITGPIGLPFTTPRLPQSLTPALSVGASWD